MRRHRRAATAVAILLLAGGCGGYTGEVGHPGPRGDQTVVTPQGWRITPAGVSTRLGSLPTASALSPDGALLVVINAGDAATQSIQVVDTATHQVVQTIGYTAPDGVHAGVAFAPDGAHVYASASGANTIHEYSVTGRQLVEEPAIALPATDQAGRTADPSPAGLAVTPDSRRLVVADQLSDSASVIDVATRQVNTVGVGHDPYGVALAPDGRIAYVGNQGADTVTVVDISGAAPVVSRTITVGMHPNRLAVDPHTGTLYTADSESDSVSVVPTGAQAPRSTIDLSPYRGAPVGSNPDALALSPDGDTVYVANSGNNDVDVVDTRTGRVRGMIPTSWYPTSVTASPGGRELFVVSAKGLGAGPNPEGPNPNTDHRRQSDPAQEPRWESQYLGAMMTGTLASIPTPDPAELSAYSRQVVADNGFDERDKVRTAVPDNPVPARVGDRSPIRHVIYVVKENRTYDQVFGSLGKGDGDPALNLFADDTAPNSRALQRQFVTLDNIYANAEVSAQGWNWSVGANSNPYVEQTWMDAYHGHRPYDDEGGNPATAMNRDPADSYIWDRLADNNITFRNYGFYETGNTLNTGPAPADPRLAAHTDPNYYGWDLTCPDSSGTFTPMTSCTARIDEWRNEFRGYLANDNLPTVELVRLPNDHTATTTPGYPTPSAYVADNDLALGRLVEEVSHSQYWSSTAIFVVEDDTQNGPDHIDAHRMPAQVISPYTHTGRVDSTFYSTTSVLRTIELIAGIAPMTQFDALAEPMFNAFTADANLTPYRAITPSSQILHTVNPANTPTATTAPKQNLDREDSIDERQANEEIWESVKGTHSHMPAPVHTPEPPTAPPGTDNDQH
jgi:YVTN family beta-propeller protein